MVTNHPHFTLTFWDWVWFGTRLGLGNYLFSRTRSKKTVTLAQDPPGISWYTWYHVVFLFEHFYSKIQNKCHGRSLCFEKMLEYSIYIVNFDDFSNIYQSNLIFSDIKWAFLIEKMRYLKISKCECGKSGTKFFTIPYHLGGVVWCGTWYKW